MRRLLRTPGPVLFTALALLAPACGDDGGGAADGSTTTAAVGESTTTAVPDDTTTTAAVTTTTEPEPTGPEPLAVDDIADLVVAWGDGTGDPLELAQDVIGFPLAVPTPDNTTPLHLSVDVFAGDDDALWLWDWSYEVLAGGPMPDIDIRTEEPSPGEVALRDFYDPIMADLGWTYSNTTGSDPGDEGGPMSVNHVYQSDEPTIVANGFTATPDPLFVWADEEQVFGEGVPGYQVDVPLRFEAGVVPVPLIRTILDELPALDDATMTGADFLTWNRSADSFDAEWGLRYFEVTIEFTLAPGSAEAAQTTLSTGLDGSAFYPGEESFFDPGFLEPAEPRLFGDEWTQPIVFADRYGGSITVGGDDAAGATVEVTVTFEPNRPPLEASTG